MVTVHSALVVFCLPVCVGASWWSRAPISSCCRMSMACIGTCGPRRTKTAGTLAQAQLLVWLLHWPAQKPYWTVTLDNTYIHTYMHIVQVSYLRNTYMHTYNVYIHTYTHTYITNIHKNLLTFKLTTYLLTYLLTYAYMDTFELLFLSGGDLLSLSMDGGEQSFASGSGASGEGDGSFFQGDLTSAPQTHSDSLR